MSFWFSNTVLRFPVLTRSHRRLIATEDTGLISEVEGQNGNQRKVTAAGA